ncbi:ABC transporter permease [Sphingomonas humi]|uniref:ABC-2 type transporter transmembrane domain-containing protein n=1 Tax=Sphingomonas humi TaxID=335630 RepID=A0ABP7RME9_9SPHN
MNRHLSRLQAAFVIARRDYSATVLSRTFLFFLLGPLFPILLGIIFGSLGAKVAGDPAPRQVAVIASEADFARLKQASQFLQKTEGVTGLPEIAWQKPGAGSPGELLRKPGLPAYSAVLSSPFERPALAGNLQADDRLVGQMRLLIAYANNPAAPPVIAVQKIGGTAIAARNAREITARAGQGLLFLLTLLLSGMLLSQLIEEKSNKVIEVLAAAVPVESIFIGKLFGMLAVSLSGIAVWTTLAVTGLAVFAPGALGALPTPAVGWPLFAFFVATYFAMSYLLIGAAFLGIGAQASTAREVQLLSMPITMGQVGLVVLASYAISDPSGRMGLGATVFPLSSPFAMLARAAMDGALWPHLVALAWQSLWIALILKLASAWFRRSVLKSGGKRRLFGRASTARPA